MQDLVNNWTARPECGGPLNVGAAYIRGHALFLLGKLDLNGNNYNQYFIQSLSVWKTGLIQNLMNERANLYSKGFSYTYAA